MSYRVLQINSVCGTGSTGRIAVDLYKVILDHGWDCAISYGRGEAPPDVKTIKIGSDTDVNIHGLLSRMTDKHGFYSRKATVELIAKIREYNPDIIHLHNIHGYYVNIEILFRYLKEAGKPVIWTLHDCWAFTGHCAYFDYIGCDRWKNLCHNCPQKKNYPKSIILDNSRWNYNKKKELFTLVKNMTIVTPSAWLANLTRESFLGQYPVKIINNGIDLEIFRPVESDIRKKYNLGNDFLILGAAGTWDARKGLDAFIEMVGKLEHGYKIIVLGVTEAQKKRLPDNILAITRTESTAELARIYSGVNLFCNPTMEDNYPTVNLEALACGTPVVAYNTGGIPEQIGPGCGLLYERGDLDGLMEGIRLIRSKMEEADNSLKDMCRSHAVKNFNKNDKYEEYMDLYRSMLM